VSHRGRPHIEKRVRMAGMTGIANGCGSSSGYPSLRRGLVRSAHWQNAGQARLSSTPVSIAVSMAQPRPLTRAYQATKTRRPSHSRPSHSRPTKMPSISSFQNPHCKRGGGQTPAPGTCGIRLEASEDLRVESCTHTPTRPRPTHPPRTGRDRSSSQPHRSTPLTPALGSGIGSGSSREPGKGS